MKKIFCLFSIFLTCSCFGLNYCKLSNKIVFDYARELAVQKGLFLTGEGGAFCGDIQDISTYYISFSKLKIEEARKLYIEVLSEFLKRFNSSKELRPFFHQYPLTIQNIRLRISFVSEDFKSLEESCIAFIFRGKDDKIIYTSSTLGKLNIVHEETYEEASKIVAENEM